MANFDISTSLSSVGISNGYSILENTSIHVPIYNDKLFVYMPPRNNREENIVVNGEYSIPDGISTICHAAFKSCADISTVIIPSTVSQIQNYAFSGCTGLNTIGTSDNI